ncbi:hypothetical protein NHX12_013991 [Muraenolepis orangiensis]|uniref:Uncharacterized protein n=1 Tax=Muraenolepis orangiensis TaxID=630683 RepID=A0A9Q0DB43_9TELE|nr:hypothetical protein NHX12_013991 [Muraenolepis orangiensis]
MEIAVTRVTGAQRSVPEQKFIRPKAPSGAWSTVAGQSVSQSVDRRPPGPSVEEEAVRASAIGGEDGSVLLVGRGAFLL